MEPRTRSIQLLNAVGVAGALAIIFGSHFVVERFTRVPIELMIGVAWAIGFATLAWRRMDETARDAHKNAWFWGGSVGLVIAFLGLLIALRLDPNPAFLQRFNHQPVRLMLDGACVAAIGAYVAFAVVWSVWWLRRR